MGSNICSLIFVTFLFLLISKSLGQTGYEIGQICDQTDDYKFCEEVFIKHLFFPDTDIKGLTQIALTQTLIYNSETIVFLDRARDHETREDIKRLYKICDSGYGLVSARIQDANFAFAKGDYRAIVFLVDKCERIVFNCQFVLGKYLPQLAEKSLQNRVLLKMSSVSAQRLLGGEVLK